MNLEFLFNDHASTHRKKQGIFLMTTYILLFFDNLSAIKNIPDFYKLTTYTPILFNTTYWYILILITIFIFSKVVIPQYLAQKRYVKLFWISIYSWTFLFLTALGMAYLLEYFLSAKLCNCAYSGSVVTTVFLANYYTLIISIPLSIFLILFYFVKKFYQEQKQHTLLIKEKTEYELISYQRKVHPEFFLNSIKSLSATSNSDTDQTKQILLFSNILSFILYDGNSELVKLEKEMAIAHELVEYENTNHPYPLTLSIHFKDNDPPSEIIPLKIINPLINLFNNRKAGFSMEKNIYIPDLNCELWLSPAHYFPPVIQN